MNKLICIILLFFSLFCFSQNETNNWLFGNNVHINFSNDQINILSGSKITTPHGSSSISNENGELLFYTDGIKVWNKNHVRMLGLNGSTLIGDNIGTQTSLIVPKPKSNNIYYIFSIKTYNENDDNSSSSGLYYSEVDMNLNNGTGLITSINNLLIKNVVGKITGVHHENGKDIWVVISGKKNQEDKYYDSFFSFLVHSNGIKTPIISKISQFNIFDPFGQLKLSPDGRKLAYASNRGGTYILEFNDKKGTVSNPRYLAMSNAPGDRTFSYGVEFSIDSQFLYIEANDLSGKSRLYQFDLKEDRNSPAFFIYRDKKRGALQLGKDGKIYNTVNNGEGFFDGTQFLSLINKPTGINFNEIEISENKINLNSGLSRVGLPNFIQSYFRNRIITYVGCMNRETIFLTDTYAPITAANWNFGDGNISSEIEPSHVYTSEGVYNVSVTIIINNIQIDLKKKIRVFALPKLIKNQKLIQCDDDNDGVSLFNLHNIETEISNDNTLSFKYYKNKDDAQNDINEIVDPNNFYNETNPQTIYAKAKTINGCTDIESFTIETLFKPILPISPMTTCEDSDYETNNSKGDFDLIKKRNEIISELSLSNKDKLSFFSTKEEALKSINELPIRFNSTTTTIWVKIENAYECSSISPIDLIVNSPKINLKDNYTICINPSSHPPITLTAESSNDRFEWKDENNKVLSTNNNYTLTREGNFSLTVYKTVNGIECSNSKSFTVNYPPSAKVESVDVNVVNELENTVSINISGNSNYEYSLDNINFAGSGTSHSFANVQPGIATIYIKDLNKCEPSITTSASIIGFPKFLTPNNDGVNDLWKVYGVSSTFFKQIDIKVFNRFGKIIYFLNDTNAEIGWDGSLNGKLLPSNDYWFHAKLKDLNNNIIDKKGHFTLKRD